MRTSAPATDREIRLGGCGVRQRHAYPAPGDAGHRPPRPCARQGVRARRPVGLRQSGDLPEFDYLHIGEIGDATDALIAHARPRCRPAGRAAALRDRRAPAAAGLPDPGLSPDRRRPNTCSAPCSSPAAARTAASSATSRRSMAASRASRSRSRSWPSSTPCSRAGPPAAIYFVDDNFIGNRKAAREMLPHLIAWQKRARLSGALRLRGDAQHREAAEIAGADARGLFHHRVLRHRDAGAGRARRNVARSTTRGPDAGGVETLNSYGMEVVSGIILGLDTDTPTRAAAQRVHRASQIPMLAINMLQALPKTPLWDRLKRDGRLSRTTARENNVVFLRPYDEVVAMWRRSIAYANDPESLFARFRHQVEATYVNRKVTPAKGKLTWLEPAPRRGDGVAGDCSTSACCRISASRSGARRSTRCVTARSTACSARLSWVTT